jgi:hypothetical protein
MAETRVVNIKHEPCDVYIGRTMGGRYAHLRDLGWGNPHRGAGAVERYEEHIRSRPDLLARLPELRGKRLGCWCKPAPCHGDVLIRLLAEREVGP